MTSTSTRLMSHTNGTRQYSHGRPGTKAEVATGKAGGKYLPPPLPAWMADPRRKCADKPTSWWYAPEEDEWGNKITTADDAKKAARLCQRCPFNLECREYGVRYEPFGIWGGVRVNTLLVAARADVLAGVARERKRRSA